MMIPSKFINNMLLIESCYIELRKFEFASY